MTTFLCGTDGVDNSCTPAGLQGIIDNQAQDGDIIEIASGTHAMSGTLVDINKNVQVNGRGIDVTNLDRPRFNLSSSGVCRLSNFTGIGSNPDVQIWSSNTRVDNVRYNGGAVSSYPMFAFGGNHSNVVVDHCTFENIHRGCNISASASYWSDPAQHAPGTLYGIYFEDCSFNRQNVENLDLNNGGAYIVRYSQINGGANVAVHGADSNARSAGYIELYNNTWNNPTQTSWAFCVNIRGGTAYIHDNTIIGPYNTAWNIQYWRSCYGLGSEGQPFHPDNANRCDNPIQNSFDLNWTTTEDPEAPTPADGWP